VRKYAGMKLVCRLGQIFAVRIPLPERMEIDSDGDFGATNGMLSVYTEA